jgi:hypothetical protein
VGDRHYRKGAVRSHFRGGMDETVIAIRGGQDKDENWFDREESNDPAGKPVVLAGESGRENQPRAGDHHNKHVVEKGDDTSHIVVDEGLFDEIDQCPTSQGRHKDDEGNGSRDGPASPTDIGDPSAEQAAEQEREGEWRILPIGARH